jgi:hypothetical protein
LRERGIEILYRSLNILNKLDEIKQQEKEAIEYPPLALSELGEFNSSDVATLDPGLSPKLFP